MIKELDVVVLMEDIPDHGLKIGDIGTVVHCYSDQQAYEVEFVRAAGQTVAVLTLTSSAVRSMADSEILHARQLAG